MLADAALPASFETDNFQLQFKLMLRKQSTKNMPGRHTIMSCPHGLKLITTLHFKQW
jgi:hypothetical protein